jgi:soluble P-type ATPase
MIDIDIPGFAHLRLEHLVLDYNGTLAVDGWLLPGVAEKLISLGDKLQLHVVTADTFGSVRNAIASIPCLLHSLPDKKQDEAKQDYIKALGCERTAAIGNGRNDRLMLKSAALGIGLILGEGAFSGTLASADIVCSHILDALDLFFHPLRLVASLRS